MDFSIGALFVELQTGITKDHAWDSNFCQFRIRNGHRHEVEQAIAAAKLGSGGLEYPPEFGEDGSMGE